LPPLVQGLAGHRLRERPLGGLRPVEREEHLRAGRPAEEAAGDPGLARAHVLERDGVDLHRAGTLAVLVVVLPLLRLGGPLAPGRAVEAGEELLVLLLATHRVVL